MSINGPGTGGTGPGGLGGGAMGGGGSRGKTSGSGGNGLFGTKTINKKFDLTPQKMTLTGANLKSLVSPVGGKRTASGTANKPGEDMMAISSATKDADTPYAKNKAALDLNDSQVQGQAPFVKAATTVLGLLPGAVAPGMGPAMTLGINMNKWSSAALRKQNETDPNSVKTDDAHPGSVYGRINGMMNSTQADVPGYNKGLGKNGQGGNSVEDQVKRKKAQLPTLLGNVSSNPLGSFNNPQIIT